MDGNQRVQRLETGKERRNDVLHARLEKHDETTMQRRVCDRTMRSTGDARTGSCRLG